MFYLSEHFFSIQGEGKYAGIPSYFLRTGKCNLSCVGFNTSYNIEGIKHLGCDSYFAVNNYFKPTWEKVNDATTFIFNLEEQFKKIGYLPQVVITGGEPLLYYKDEIFYAVVTWLVEQGISVTFETNGTIDIDFKSYPIYKNIIFALSVKLSNSNEAFSTRVNFMAIKNILDNSFDSFFKFTIDNKLIETTALEEITEITSKFLKPNIYCMPLGQDQLNISFNAEDVFKFCMKHGFNYSDRLHIRIFNTERGV